MSSLSVDVRCAMSVRLLLGAVVLVGGVVLPVRRGSAEHDPEPPSRPPRAVGLASEYRGEEHVFLCNPHVLPNGRWFVAALGRRDAPAELLGSRTEIRLMPCGWIAVNLSTGDARHLLPPPDRKLPVDVEMGRCGFSDMVLPWGVDSCVVAAHIASKDRLTKPTPQSMLNKGPIEAFLALHPVETFFYWEWNPKSDTTQPLGWHAGVWRLARGLQKTSYRIRSWERPPERTPPLCLDNWSGRVLLSHRAGGDDLPFLSLESGSHPEVIITRFAEAERQQGRSFTIPENRNLWDFHGGYIQDFGPTEHKDSLVEVHGCGAAYNAVYIQRIAMKPGFPVDWRINQRDIERRLGEALYEVHLVRGATHPCRYLPLLLLTKSRKGQQRPLWLLNTKTGSLEGPLAISWDSTDGIGGIPVHTFTDATARFLAYQPPRRFVNFVYDLQARRTIARLSDADERYLQLVGFDSDGNIVLFEADRSEIFLWLPPFKKGRKTQIYGEKEK